jgi:hypothetical protein
MPKWGNSTRLRQLAPGLLPMVGECVELFHLHTQAYYTRDGVLTSDAIRSMGIIGKLKFFLRSLKGPSGAEYPRMLVIALDRLPTCRYDLVRVD